MNCPHPAEPIASAPPRAWSLFMGWLGSLFTRKKKFDPKNMSAAQFKTHQLRLQIEKANKIPKTKIAERFALEMRIGQGSMSKVWRARDGKLGRMVCLKILDKVKTKRFDARFGGLVRPHEGMIGAALKHKNCVQTYEWGLTQDGEIFLVMEMVDGVGLNFLIETRSKQLEGNRINYLCQAAEGLAYMHESGYMHRDICPRNMLVNSQGILKLIDFGLSLPNTADFHKPGNRTGSANYMAPELVRRSFTDHRVDLFALGVTAYEVFTTALPWDSSQSLQAAFSRMNSAAKDPREAKPGLAEPIAKFLDKAIARVPDERFQTALEFRDALRKLGSA
jgi:serine/threonine protein kinase